MNNSIVDNLVTCCDEGSLLPDSAVREHDASDDGEINTCMFNSNPPKPHEPKVYLSIHAKKT